MYNQGVREKLYTYFKTRWQMEDYHHGWLRGDCPDCGRKKKWGVQLFTDRSNCFVCGYRGRPLAALMLIENFTERVQAYNFLRVFESVNVPELERLERSQEGNPNVKAQPFLPGGFKNLLLGESTVAKIARKYVIKRGFKVNRLAQMGIGYCIGDNDYFGYLIFPFQVKGKLVYFQARKFVGTGPKFNNPEVEKFGIGKTQLIYNWDALWVYKKIWVVESITNALTIGANAIAIMGKHISKYQLSTLIKSPAQDLVICLDHDARKQAIELALKLIPYKNTKLILLPDDRDVNDWGRKEIRGIEKTQDWVTHRQLLKLKNEDEA